MSKCILAFRDPINLINNLTTNQAGVGALDASMGKELYDKSIFLDNYHYREVCNIPQEYDGDETPMKDYYLSLPDGYKGMIYNAVGTEKGYIVMKRSDQNNGFMIRIQVYGTPRIQIMSCVKGVLSNWRDILPTPPSIQ